MTDNNPEEERDWDPPGNEERTGHTEDLDGNFAGGDTVNPEDRPGDRFEEDLDSNFGEDPVDESDDDSTDGA
jgi:hypothetical protein